jgi:putative spermidine/putrescine transport system substrate-binding protein
MVLNRRSFLTGVGAITLAHLLSGCSNNSVLAVQLLQGSIPPQLLGQFSKDLGVRVALNFKAESQLQDLSELLKNWKNPTEVKTNKWTNWLPFINKKTPTIADLVTLGDYWLTDAIAKQLIQPIKVENLSEWQQLPELWQNIVRRDRQGKLDKNGELWGAPYRWGCTAIVYRKDKFEKLGWIPQDWSDLWREELRDRISLLDSSREVIGLTLKKLRHSYNTDDLTKIPELKTELTALNKQVKFYDSTNYLQPLILEDTWLAVGWSSDLLPLQKRYSNLEVIIPKSGTSLWADIWVKPSQINNQGSTNDLSFWQKWIDFCWQPRSASEISLFTSAASPILFKMSDRDLPKDIRDNKLLLPDPEIIKKSEFLLPLSPETSKQYESLWTEIRQPIWNSSLWKNRKG